MALYHMRQRDPLVDPNTQAALERRARELAGIGLILLATVFTVMLMSYSPEDPGWLVASDQPVSNWLGGLGAAIASTLVIIIGRGAWAIPVILLAWGLRFVLHRGAERAMGRVVFALIAVAMASAFAATHAPGEAWARMHTFGPGGQFGDAVMGAIIGVAPVKATFGLKVISLISGLVFLATLAFVTGFDREELQILRQWAMVGAVMAYSQVMQWAGQGAVGAAQAAQSLQERHRQRRADAQALRTADAAMRARQLSPVNLSGGPSAAAPGAGFGASRHGAAAPPALSAPGMAMRQAADPMARATAAARRHRVIRAGAEPGYGDDFDAMPDDTYHEGAYHEGARAGFGQAQPMRGAAHTDLPAPRPISAPQPILQPIQAPKKKEGFLGDGFLGRLLRPADPQISETSQQDAMMAADDLPPEDRIKARISDVIRARVRHGMGTAAPAPHMTPLQAAIARREPSLTRRGGTAMAPREEPPVSLAGLSGPDSVNIPGVNPAGNAVSAAVASAAARAAAAHAQLAQTQLAQTQFSPDRAEMPVAPVMPAPVAAPAASAAALAVAAAIRAGAARAGGAAAQAAGGERPAPLSRPQNPAPLQAPHQASAPALAPQAAVYFDPDEADDLAELIPDLAPVMAPAAPAPTFLSRRAPAPQPRIGAEFDPDPRDSGDDFDMAPLISSPVAARMPAEDPLPESWQTRSDDDDDARSDSAGGYAGYETDDYTGYNPILPPLQAPANPVPLQVAPLRTGEMRAGESRAGDAVAPRISAPLITPEVRRGVVQHAQGKPLQPSRQAQSEAQPRLRFDEQMAQPYELPPLSLLTPAATIQRHALSDEALEENARMLESVLDDYGVKGEIVSVRPGPVVTMYELEPAPGLKASRVIGLADDIARSMSALSARVSTVPGRSVIGIELPNVQREKVVLREILAARDFGDSQMRLPLALGKDIGGDAVVANLAKMPHLLIAGTTGSGKSVAINTMILSLLYKLTPEECRLIMIDPKMLELSVYDGIPHLLSPVVTDPKKAVVALKWVVGEMEERYRKMSRMGVRNIDGYNGRVREAMESGEMFRRTVQTGFDDETGEPVFETEEFAPAAFPYIVVIVDEMADLMMVAGKEIEACIQRLAQMARASGIHLIMATQRPSVDVITGTIKANFPTRISFQVTSKIDSRTILGEQGAEQLLGQGDMLYMGNGQRITRIHGPFVSDEEVEEIVTHLKSFGPPHYMSGVVEGPDDEVAGDIDAVLGLNAGDGEDALYDQAVAIVARDRKCSTSYIQRKLGIGYNKAARLVEQMEEQGVVTPANHVGKREILIPEA